MFSNQNIVHISHLTHAYYMSRPSHPPPCYARYISLKRTVVWVCLVFKIGERNVSRHVSTVRSKCSWLPKNRSYRLLRTFCINRRNETRGKYSYID
jgi:hypothetical protein